MNVGKISIRYAKALYEFAASNNETQKVYEQVMSMEKNLCAEKNYRTYISIPTLSNNQKVEILKTYVGTTPCESLEAFIVFLTQQNREESIRHICLSFVDYYRQREGISYCTLTSTTPLSEEETKNQHFRCGRSGVCFCTSMVLWWYVRSDVQWIGLVCQGAF